MSYAISHAELQYPNPLPTPCNSPALRAVKKEDEDFLAALSNTVIPRTLHSDLEHDIDEVRAYDASLITYSLIPFTPLKTLPPLNSNHSSHNNTMHTVTNEIISGAIPPYSAIPRKSYAAVVSMPPTQSHTLLPTEPKAMRGRTHRATPPLTLRQRLDGAVLTNHMQLTPPSSHDNSNRSTSSSDDSYERRILNKSLHSNRPYPPRSPILPPRKRDREGLDKTSPLRPSKNVASYRAWPAFRQAIADRERNATARVDAIHAECQTKREEEAATTTHLAAELNRAIANYRADSDFVIQTGNMQYQRQALDDRAKSLDERVHRIERQEHVHSQGQQLVMNWRDRLIQTDHNTPPSQVDRLSRVYIQLTDLLKCECNLGSPVFAFQLHRRISPALLQLTTALAEPDVSVSTIIADESAVLYYKLFVQELQSQLYDDEWSRFKDTFAPFESQIIHSNPRPRQEDLFDTDSSTSDNDW
jgi:hypothetical protein